MSYSISGSGHGADVEKVKNAFADLVESLDEATSEGGTQFSGSVSGSEDGVPFTVNASDVRSSGVDAEASPG